MNATEQNSTNSPELSIQAVDNKIVQYNAKSFTRCNISQSDNKNYQHAILDYVSAKGGQFDGVDFSYSILSDCYFHQAVFTNCKFIGARFYRCNFRGARFNNCVFDYLDANETRIEADEIIKCLPDEPNKSREICQVLRRNANSLGDTRDSRRYVIKELEDRKEHLRRAIRKQGKYYKEHYPGRWVNVKLRAQLALLNADSFCWGHGEKIWKMIFPLSLILIFATVFQTFAWLGENPTSPVSAVLGNAIGAICFYASFLLSVDSVRLSPSPLWIEWVLAVVRILAFGMLVSSLFRWLSHR